MADEKRVDDAERTESSPGGIGPSEIPDETVSSESDLSMSSHIARRDGDGTEGDG